MDGGACSGGGFFGFLGGNKAERPSGGSGIGNDLEGARHAARGAEEAVRRQVAEAVVKGGARELQAALAEAQRLGLHGAEVRRARDALLALEAHDFRKRADLIVEEAIDSDDWWKMQAAMQTVVGSGLGNEQASRLQEAMKTYKRRQEAAKELRTATESRDPARLRTAIEHALKAYVKEPLVKQARDDLRSLEARTAAMQGLRRVASGGDQGALKAAIEAAERVGLKDPEERRALEKAKGDMRATALSKLDRLHQAEDHAGLQEALVSSSDHFLTPEQTAEYKNKLATLRAQDKCRQALQLALQSGEKHQLQSALASAQQACLREADLQRVHQALRAVEAQEHVNLTRAQATEGLRTALQSEDTNCLAAALAAAEQAGVGGQEAAPALERLRYLRSRGGAVQELQAAAKQEDIYRLRAALATARGAHVSEAELQRAREALKVLEAQAHARRSMEGAMASRDPVLLQSSIDYARQAGLAKRELSQAEAELRSLGHSTVALELRTALAGGDLERLRLAAQAATDAGLSGPEVDAARERIRQMESHQWLRKQLQAAIDSRDTARLQAALRQAESAGLRADDRQVLAARQELEKSSAQMHARQELQLARAGGNPYALLAAIRTAEGAGMGVEELAAARAELKQIGGGASPTGPPTEPQFYNGGPPTNPQLPRYPSTATNYGEQMSETNFPSCATNPQLQAYHGLPSCVTNPQIQDPGFPSCPTNPQVVEVPTTRPRVTWAQ